MPLPGCPALSPPGLAGIVRHCNKVARADPGGVSEECDLLAPGCKRAVDDAFVDEGVRPVSGSEVRQRRGGLGHALLRRLPLLGTLIGLGLGAWLVATNDLSKIGDAFGRIGWLGLAGIVLVRIATNLLCGLAWGCILERLAQTAPVAMPAFLKLRFVREGINNLLPVASVGGDLMGGRLLTFWGATGALAAASILVDMLIQVGTQVLFAACGVLLLMRIEGEAAAAMAGWMVNALAVAAALLAGFFLVQRIGAARVVERLLADAVRRFAGGKGDRTGSEGGIQEALDALWAPDRIGRLAQSILLHFAAWMLAAAEIWIALACIGVEIGLTEVIVLESLAQAIKSAAFPVPSGLGVQEAGFALVGAIVGIDADTAIALSLAKRVPDVVLGLPALLYWQRLEARRQPLVQAPAR